MNVRWRLSVLSLQLTALGYATYWITGRPYAPETWFAAGMLALIINPQILEPFYPRPVDVVANGLIGLLLYLTANRTAAPIGWNSFLAVNIGATLLAVVALVFGAGKWKGRLVGLARSATIITRVATSRCLYSAVFWLGLLGFRSPNDRDFWILGVAWAFVTAIGVINWQAAWGSLDGRATPCAGEGMLGPSLLVVTAPELPSPGTPVTLRSAGTSGVGVLLSRIQRASGYWGEIHVDDPAVCEKLARASVINIATGSSGKSVVGAVLAPSSDSQLQFVSTRDLETGAIVAVAHRTAEILYQVRWAAIEEAKVKGGAQHVVRAFAAQLGVFNETTHRLVKHRWVPTPGGAVYLPPTVSTLPVAPTDWLRLGNVGNSSVPVYLDCAAACEGHTAILGMTRMGKTTLARRLASHLAATRRVTILDQTGEWIGRIGLPAYTEADDSQFGISVLEPRPKDVFPDFAHAYLKRIANLGYTEYKIGNPLSRIVIIDEAHQFVPEPAGMGFNAAGRESALNCGLLMMQVRKYGISIILISQRTAVVAKSALSQCENLIAFKNVDQTGLEYLESILGSDAKKSLPTLRHGEALAFGPAVSSDTAVQIVIATA